MNFNMHSENFVRGPTMVFDSLDCKLITGFGAAPMYDQFDTDIEATDVLCGRGKTSFNHVGNRRFRDIIANSVDKYNSAKSRLEKSMVVHSIVEQVKKVKGRFLKQDRFSGRWYELDERQAKEKVGHAIRDATSSVDPKKKNIKKLRSKATTPAPSPGVVRCVSSEMGLPKLKAQRTISCSSNDESSKSDSTRTSTSDEEAPWEDLEPLHVDSMEARNSLVVLQKDDFFLQQMKAVLGQLAQAEEDEDELTPWRLEVV
jgi:hypothetical protein